jgi:uncharacterized membrane protein YsdA (DUF1294 family)
LSQVVAVATLAGQMTPVFTGRIAEWDNATRCGWVDSDGQRIFLHRREFAEMRKRPEVGDVVRFTAGNGPSGVLCAKNAMHLSNGGRFGFLAGSLFIALLVLPAAAIARLSLPPLTLAAYIGLVNASTFILYRADKQRARSKDWRIKETSLHFMELIGGWPGAFLAQRFYRHKCFKLSYQIAFWLIVLLHQFVAFDALQEWKLMRKTGAALYSGPGAQGRPR